VSSVVGCWAMGTHFAAPLPGGLHMSMPISHGHHVDERAGSVVLDADRAGLVFWLVCDRLGGMVWGKVGMGVGDLASARPSNRTDIRTASWRGLARRKTLNELASVQHARARDGLLCRLVGAGHSQASTVFRNGARPAASHLGPLDFRAPEPRAGRVGRVGRGEITSQKTPICSPQRSPTLLTVETTTHKAQTGHAP
jgi:hypothetical protein